MLRRIAIRIYLIGALLIITFSIALRGGEQRPNTTFGNIQKRIGTSGGAEAYLKITEGRESLSNDELLCRAEALLQLGRESDGIALLEAVAQEAPENDEAIVKMGDLYYVSSDIDSALRAYEQAYKISPNGPVALRMSNAYYRLGKIEEAGAIVREQIVDWPTAAMFRQLEWVYERLGNSRLSKVFGLVADGGDMTLPILISILAIFQWTVIFLVALGLVSAGRAALFQWSNLSMPLESADK